MDQIGCTAGALPSFREVYRIGGCSVERITAFRRAQKKGRAVTALPIRTTLASALGLLLSRALSSKAIFVSAARSVPFGA
jgi:hypothetical protein